MALASRNTMTMPVWISLRPWLPSLILLPFCGYFLSRHGDAVFVDQLDMLIHEAGHLCFYFLGDILHAAGGSLMQIVLPMTLAFHFWQYHARMGMQVSLLWLGQNFLDVSVYAADARIQELDLMSGRMHDWSYLLGKFGLLEYDQLFAFLFCFLAMLSFIAMLMIPLLMEEQGA